MVSLLTIWLLPGMIRIGHTRISVFGFFAAAGVIGAIWLSQRTARMVGLPEQKLWDAGVFVVFSAFVLSRVLLIAQDFAAFVRYPLIVLSLPSLTYGGVALTVVATLVYLRVVKLPLLAVMDAWAPCAAVLAAVLALAHFVEGTDAGMPTRMPWGIVTPGDTVLGRVQPVQMYAIAVAMLVLFVSYRALGKAHAVGSIGAWTLVVGGLTAFALNMLSQPVDTNGTEMLEAGQIAALAVILMGAMVLLLPRRLPVQESIEEIQELS